jgi:hypothetical protein
MGLTNDIKEKAHELQHTGEEKWEALTDKVGESTKEVQSQKDQKGGEVHKGAQDIADNSSGDGDVEHIEPQTTTSQTFDPRDRL